MDRAIQKICRSSFESYCHHHKVPLDQYRAAHAFIACRTPALGGSVQSCPNGCETHIQYHSCKHRACPQCNFTASTRWLEKQKSRLIHCPHHHVIFTLPHELNVLWLFNKASMMQLLFKVVQQTLLELLHDPKHLGAEPGIIAAFHSWGRSLVIHPHLHCLVSAGGLSAEQKWLKPKKSFLLVGGVVRDLFRGKYLATLKLLLQQKKLELPPDKTEQIYLNLVNKLGRKKWNVRIEKRYDHPDGVINYLSRYVRGGPFKNQQIQYKDREHINFRYFDHNTQKVTQTPFLKEQFLAMALEHVPPYRRQVIRHWGLYSGRCLESRNQARAILGQAPELKQAEQIPSIDWQTCLEKAGLKTHGLCKTCHQPLKTIKEIPKQKGQSP